MFDHFTDPARATLVGARAAATRLGAPRIGPDHVLLSLLATRDTAAERVLRSFGVDAERLGDRLTSPAPAFADDDVDALSTLGIDLAEIRRRTEQSFGPGALDRGAAVRRGSGRGPSRFTDAAKRSLAASVEEARSTRSRGVGTGQLLLGLLADDRDEAAVALREAGLVDRAAVRRRVLEQPDPQA